MKFVLLLVLVGAAATTSPIVGDTYSCFTDFESISTGGCSKRYDSDEYDGYVQEGITSIQDMDFCSSGPTYGRARQGQFSRAKNYIASADLKQLYLGKYSKSNAYNGLAFNMIDDKNYDIAYVRPQTKNEEFCWELGYVEDGLLFGRDFGGCLEPVGNQYNIAIKMENKQGTIYVDGAPVHTFSPVFPSVNRVATTMRNNMPARMLVQNLQVCQEINCRSRGKNNAVVITKPGEEFTEADIGACERCECGLYGQMKCGCRDLEEQGISCPSGKIAATGPDCCARCVPPSATCTAAGDPHIVTFDGTGYNYQGVCTYCVIKTDDFQVNSKLKGISSTWSVHEYSMIIFDGCEYEMRNGVLTRTNLRTGQAVTLTTPYKKLATTENWIYCQTGSTCDIYMMNTKVLQISSYYNNFRAWVHGYYYEHTECLCGLWDGKHNEFHDKDGPVSSAIQMGEAWRVDNDDGCPPVDDEEDPCEKVTQEEKNWVEAVCSRYKQEPFRSCPLDVTEYFEDCKFDLCTDFENDDNVCADAEAYAKACEDAGYPVNGWRSNNFCPETCDDTFVYMDCGKGCQPTCSDPNPSDCLDFCVEGCYCPEGTVLQGGKCIESIDCQCMWDGQIIEEGQSWNDSVLCQTCMCMSGGYIDCNPTTCADCPEGHATVYKSGLCCPICLADWIDERNDTIILDEGDGPAVLDCMILDDAIMVSKDDVTWRDGRGEILSPDTIAENFEFSDGQLILTFDPAHLVDGGKYTAEVTYNGAVGTCTFNVIVNPVTPVDIIDIDGDSPLYVKEGDCQTMSVKVVDSSVHLSADDFTWYKQPGNKEIDFSNDKYSKKNKGKSLQVCAAEEADEGRYEACVTVGSVKECVQIDLIVLAVCEDEDGTERVEGSTWMESEFKNCTCTHLGGDPVCDCVSQTNTCTDEEVTYFDKDCKLSCAPQPGTCTVTGDPHYTTFDGLRHDFQGGNCRFTMAQTEDFVVVVTNGHHERENTTVSWTDAIEVLFLTLHVKLDTSGTVHINGEPVFLPYNKFYRKSDATVSVTEAAGSVVVRIVEAVDVTALDLIWDGNSTVYCTVHGKYYEGTGGLCGYFDGKAANDLTQSDGTVTNDLTDFGWSWKYGDEECDLEPQPEHPCKALGTPDYVIDMADSHCDLLDSAPFSNCHSLLDVEGAKEICKYDVCACFDGDCACPSIKQYVKECLDAGGKGLEGWRSVANFCPMNCEEPYQYEPCGSFCPPTCADKNPTCEDGCNEGCFCPVDTFLQNGTCVSAEDCMCQVNGTFVDEGHTWQDLNICKDCSCRANGNIVCEKMHCKKCSNTEIPINTEGSCCNECIEDWVWPKDNKVNFKEITYGSRQELRIQSVAKPYKFWWYYKAKDADEWVEIDKEGDREMTRYYLALDPVGEGDAGKYKWKGQRSNRIKEIEFTVTTSKF